MGGASDGKEVRKRILVVDDEESVRDLCVACIRHALGEEYEVVEAANGSAAIATAKTQRPDLILLDIMMPDMDGFEVCRRLKSSPVTQEIPVVFLTALGRERTVEKGLALGGEGYVVKPFNAVTLAAQISELLAEDSDTAL